MASIPATFKAFEYTHHGADPLSEVKMNSNATLAPLLPSEVTVKVYSASINPVDWKLVPYGAAILPTPASPEHPVRMGMDLSGVIVALGENVKDYKIGDAIYVMQSVKNFGAFAEYANVDVKFIAPKPESLSFNEAAGAPMVGQTSLQALTVYGKLQAGQRVLILGGSSSTGIFAIQQAKTFGAYVIATCSTRNVELVTSLGADQVIDYTKEKWSEVLEAGSIDLIYDCGVEPNSWNDEAQKVLKKDTGIFVTIQVAQNPITSPIGATYHHFLTQSSTESLSVCSKLIEEGKLKVVIDSVFSLDDTLEAIKRQMTGRASGKVIIEVVKQ